MPMSNKKRRPSVVSALPASVELRNVFVEHQPLMQKTKWFRPEHSASLLRPIRLQIVKLFEHTDETIVIYSKEASPTIHPSWQHINEQVTNGDEEQFKKLSEQKQDSPSSLMLQFITDADPKPFLQVPLQKLVRVRMKQQSKAGNSSIGSNLSSNITDSLKLPINAVLVKYAQDEDNTSDDVFLRIPPSLCELLVEQRQIRNDQLAYAPANARFDDNVFDTLDSVQPQQSPPRNSFTDSTGVSTEIPGVTRKEGESSLDRGAGDGTDDGSTYALLEQQKRLEALLQEETLALQQKLSELRDAHGDSETSRFLTMIQEIQITESQTAQVCQATRQLQMDLARTHFLIHAQRIRLFSDLQTIYPIQVELGQERYRIRGLELPLPQLAMNEEEVSAAAGYLCHVVSKMSKYLAVPLRYRLYYQSSRSVIQDGATTGGFFPLFLTRNERDKFAQGMDLLHRNVDFLAQEVGVHVATKLHILAKVKRIYEAVIEGY